MDKVVNLIKRGIRRLINHPTCQQWVAEQSPRASDICLVNNSFVYRDVSTAKSEQYIALKIGDNGKLEPTPYIATGPRINSDFKHVAAKLPKFPTLTTLQDAVKAEMVKWGSLAFIPIGHVEDTIVIEQSMNHKSFAKVVWDPTLETVARVIPPVIMVQYTYDEDAIWSQVAAWFAKRGESIPNSLRESVGVALDKLQDRATAKLNLPMAGESKRCSMTDDIIKVLREQRKEYRSALALLVNQQPRTAALNDILRIAYNFASDATMFLRLIVSICDLKPIVLWGTIAEHFRLSESFKQIPWVRSHNKPSLKNYISTISDARNSAFHNLFPFRKSLSVALPESALQNASLRIFSEYGKKKENQLNYQDRELTEVLFEFTRARERRVPIRFWQQNLEVMDNSIDLFDKTSNFLKAIFAAKQKIEKSGGANLYL